MQSGIPKISPHPPASGDPVRGDVDLSVVIVNYNVRDFLEQALHSVMKASRDLSVEVFVVDNNSADGSVEMVIRRFERVRLIANRENLGFGRANNIALRLARGRYTLVLNPDTIVQEDTLATLVSFMDEHEDAGAVGCQILNPDGSFARESRRSFPAPDVAFYRMIGLSRLFPGSPRFGRYNMTFLPRDETAEVDALSGSCMLIRTAALRGSDSRPGAGLFDEAFFMYGEDLDLCYRIQQAGWKIYYHPKTQIIHYKGESTKKGDLRHVRLFYGAMLLFIDKHLDPNRSRALSLMLRAGIVAGAGLSLLKSGLNRLGAPFVDFLLVYASVTSVALLRFAGSGEGVAPLFFATVPAGYGLATALGIGVVGGYRRGSGLPVSSALQGLTAGFLTVATASFFVPAIAFSRIVVLLSFPVAALCLLVRRALYNTRRAAPRKAVLVGDAEEASRLSVMLDAHPRRPFELEGFVSDTDSVNGLAVAGSARLGRVNQLRDLIRFRSINEVVFAGRSLSNQAIFETMRSLQDLGVQFRMLHEGSEHLIGKASISRLSVGATLAELPEVVVLRTRASRRLFEICVTAGAAVLSPIAPLVLPLGGIPVVPALKKLRQAPAVLTGRLALVGCRPEDAGTVPTSWNLPPGVFSITNTLKTDELDTDDLLRAYWFYVTHQSPGLDADIMIRSLRDERATGKA